MRNSICLFILVFIFFGCAGPKGLVNSFNVKHLIDELIVYEEKNSKEWCLGFCVMDSNEVDTLIINKGVTDINRIGFLKDTLIFERFVKNQNIKYDLFVNYNEIGWEYFGFKNTKAWLEKNQPIENVPIIWKFIPQELSSNKVEVSSFDDNKVR